MYATPFFTCGERYLINKMLHELRKPEELEAEIQKDEEYVRSLIRRDDNYFVIATMSDDILRKESALWRSTIWYTLKPLLCKDVNCIIVLYMGSYHDYIEEVILESTRKMAEYADRMLSLVDNISKICEYETILRKHDELTRFSNKFSEIIKQMEMREMAMNSIIFGGDMEKESLGVKWDGNYPRKNFCKLL
jgi:hypothetical protein